MVPRGVTSSLMTELAPLWASIYLREPDTLFIDCSRDEETLIGAEMFLLLYFIL